MLRRGGITEIAWVYGKFFDPASSQHHNSGGGGGGGGGSPEKNSDLSVSQLSALATLDQLGGASLKAPLSFLCHKLGSAIFWRTLVFFAISTKKRCL